MQDQFSWDEAMLAANTMKRWCKDHDFYVNNAFNVE